MNSCKITRLHRIANSRIEVEIVFKNGFFRKLFKLSEKRYTYRGKLGYWTKLKETKYTSPLLSFKRIGEASSSERVILDRIWKASNRNSTIWEIKQQLGM